MKTVHVRLLLNLAAFILFGTSTVYITVLHSLVCIYSSISGPICGPGQELPTAYVHAKFEGRSFIRLRNIGTFRCGALIDPMTLTFDLLTLKSVWESHVTCMGYPCAKFRL